MGDSILKFIKNEGANYFVFANDKNEIIASWKPNYSILNFQKATNKNSQIYFYNINEFHLEAIIPQLSLLSEKLPRGVEIKSTTNKKTGTVPISVFIPFQFVDSITVKERTPSYSPQNIMSRFEPVRIWQSGNYLGIDLKLTYLAVDFDYNEEWVEQMVALYKALVMPTYTNSPSFYPPPLLYLKFGDLFDNIPCVATGISREFPMGMFAYNDTEAIDFNNKNIKINALPKYQTITLNLESQYPRTTYVDLHKTILREEGIKRWASTKTKP